MLLHYRDAAFIRCKSGLHSTLRSYATGAWIRPSWEASKLDPGLQRSHTKTGALPTVSRAACADSWPPEVYISPRISCSHEQVLEQLVPKLLEAVWHGYFVTRAPASIQVITRCKFTQKPRVATCVRVRRVHTYTCGCSAARALVTRGWCVNLRWSLTGENKDV